MNAWLVGPISRCSLPEAAEMEFLSDCTLHVKIGHKVECHIFCSK